MRRNISSNSPYEPVFGFSRAVRAGNHVFVAGTAGWRQDGTMSAEDGVYVQTRQAIAIIEKALNEAGASLADVVRTRVYVVDLAEWEEVARAHREAFADIRPASSLICVEALASPEMLVELEADAVIDA